MIFEINRASCWEKDKAPCDGAILKKGIIKCKSNAAHLGQTWDGGEDWMSSGFNHRVEDGKLTKDMPRRAWYIEINSLEELINLCKSEENSIVFNPTSIVIYDDSLE